MKILIAPLDWGLGHATRCVPLIRALRAAGHEVVVCASGAGLRLLRAEFPELETRALSSYAMRYTKNRALLPLWLFLQLPLFLFSVWRDGRAARRIACETGAGFIIADGRYGFRCGGARGVPAVFISHQLDILPPGPRALRALIAPALRALNRRALAGFREIWVPDFPGTLNLSGMLGHPEPGILDSAGPQVHYIHPLCRFRPDALTWDHAYASGDRGEGLDSGSGSLPIPAIPPLPSLPLIDTLAVLSGPEPQRTLLEAILIRAFADLPGTRVIVRGLPPAAVSHHSGFGIRPVSINIFDHLSQEKLLGCLEAARTVVCRSGYTTMMELAGLGKGNVLLVPTPGQPEQEYLAVHARASGFAAWRDQDALDVPAALQEAGFLPGFGSLFATDSGSAGFSLTEWIARHPLLSK